MKLFVIHKIELNFYERRDVLNELVLLGIKDERKERHFAFYLTFLRIIFFVRLRFKDLPNTYKILIVLPLNQIELN